MGLLSSAMKQALGNDLNLGYLGDSSEMLRFTAEQRATHLFVCGSTGTGKSKLLESLVRQDISSWYKSNAGMLLIDPHGSLYESVVRWLAWNKDNLRNCPIVPIDLRQDDWVVSYNVLRQRPKSDPAVVINNFVQAMAHVWGAQGTDETPRFERWASNVLLALYEKKLTLVEAGILINQLDKRKRWAVTEGLTSKLLADDWTYMNLLEASDFDAKIESTTNRLRRFLGTQKLQQMFGQPTRSLDLSRSLEEGHIILVNLATERNRVSEEDGALFATLLLSDLWTAAKERGKKTDARQVKPFYIYADEFQKFITPTMAQNLNEARGFGLHLTLANQFPRQILHAGPQGEEVYDSIMQNARSKIVFETRGEENLRPLALDLFRGTMSPDKIKHELYSTKVMGYKEETREVRSRGRSEGKSQGTHKGHAAGAGLGGTQGFMGDDTTVDPNSTSLSNSEFAADSEASTEGSSESESESVAEVPFMVPQFGQELSSRQFETIEDQIFRAMSVLHDQKQRHSVARLVDSKAPAVLRTPTIEATPGSEDRTRAYLDGCYRRLPCAIRSSLAKKQLIDRAENIVAELNKAPKSEPTTSKRPVK